jgi:hypothetical protein
LTNIWRLQKVKEHTAGEIMAEDDAFDRYMLNASLLEEVFALNAEGLRGIDADIEFQQGQQSSDTKELSNGGEASLVDAMRTRLAADTKRKEASRQRLKQTIERALRKLNNPEQEPEVNVEEEDTSQVGVSGAVVSEKRWEPKRSKARTEEGQRVLETMEAFEGLMKLLDNIKSPEDIQGCLDAYLKDLGGNLSYLIPNLCPREDVDSGSSGEKKVDSTLISPRATLLNYLSGAFLEKNPAGQVVINNRNTDLPLSRSLKVKERPWESGVEKLERIHWHRKYLRGMGWWKVYAHDETIHSMCFERANANTTIMEL